VHSFCPTVNSSYISRRMNSAWLTARKSSSCAEVTV